MKISDYIANFLENKGINAVFGITGSVVTDILDSCWNRKNIKLYNPIHEQTASMAAHAYSLTCGKPGVAISTSGPGATNLLTGLTCAWYDSVAVLHICGQVNSNFLKGQKKVRQIGFQETDIVGMAKCVTKYSKLVLDPLSIRYELEKAIYLATEGRPGPVLLDIPVDIQKTDIDPKKLKSYKPDTKISLDSKKNQEKKIKLFIVELKKAKRPVVLLGGGLRHASKNDGLMKLLKIFKIPVVTTWAAMDLIENSHFLYRGRIGTYGQRGANLTLQNSDLLLSLGSRHDGRQTGGKLDSFAREAKRFIVDIDLGELKFQQIKGDVNIHADLNKFIPLLSDRLSDINFSNFKNWLTETKNWQEKFPTVLNSYRVSKNNVNAYYFMEELSDQLKNWDIVVGDCGANIVSLAQAFKVKPNQKIITSWSHSPMGYSFSAAIGAYLAKNVNTKNVICTIGDGGMQVNIQELQTYKMYNFPIKVFVLNNKSYGIIKQYQDTYLKSRYVGADLKWGYSYPDFKKVAHAYGLKTEIIKNNIEVPIKLKKILKMKGPVICEVNLDPKTNLQPRLGWNTGIEDQWPHLKRNILKKHLYIKPYSLKNK